MDLLIAILIYLGLATSTTEVSADMIEQYNGVVETYQHDPGFLEFYHKFDQENQTHTESIGIMDINDGN